MTIITVDELKNLLNIKKVKYDLTDAELTTLLDFKIKEISGLCGFDIEAVSHTHREYLRGKSVLLNHYPVESVISVNIDRTSIPQTYYTVDFENGIINLDEKMYGIIIVNYLSKLPNTIILNVVNPLLVDMIQYELENAHNDLSDISSISEGGISVSYNTSSNLSSRIQQRILELKTYHNAKVKVI